MNVAAASAHGPLPIEESLAAGVGPFDHVERNPEPQRILFGGKQTKAPKHSNERAVMSSKKRNQKSTTSPLPNHQGLPVARHVEKPAIRLYDTGNHVYPPAEWDAHSSPYNPLGAMLAVAVAAKRTSVDGSPDPAAVLLLSRHDEQRLLHQALVADLGLDVSTAALHESGRPQGKVVILDFIAPWAAYDSEDIWGRFRHDQGFLTAAFAAARRETVLLGDDFEFQQLPAEAALRRQLEVLQQAGTEFEPFPEILFQPAANLDGPGISFFPNLNEAHRLIRQDVAAAQNRIIWNLLEVTRDDSTLIQRRPNLEQVLVQPVTSATVRRWEDLGYRVCTDLRGEACIFVDDDLVWLIGSPRNEEAVRPFARVRGRRTACLLAKLYKLSEFFTPTKTQ